MEITEIKTQNEHITVNENILSEIKIIVEENTEIKTNEKILNELYNDFNGYFYTIEEYINGLAFDIDANYTIPTFIKDNIDYEGIIYDEVASGSLNIIYTVESIGLYEAIYFKKAIVYTRSDMEDIVDYVERYF